MLQFCLGICWLSLFSVESDFCVCSLDIMRHLEGVVALLNFEYELCLQWSGIWILNTGFSFRLVWILNMSYSGLNCEYQVSVLLSVPCPSSNKYIRDKYHLDHVLQWCASILILFRWGFCILNIGKLLPGFEFWIGTFKNSEFWTWIPPNYPLPKLNSFSRAL